MIPQALFLSDAQAATTYEVRHDGVTVSCEPGRDPRVLHGIEREVSAGVVQVVESNGTVERGLDGGWWVVPAKHADEFAQAAKAEIARRKEAQRTTEKAFDVPAVKKPSTTKKGG